MTSILYTDKGGLILINDEIGHAKYACLHIFSLAYFVCLAKCMAMTLVSKEHCLVEWMRQAKNAASLRAEIATVGIRHAKDACLIAMTTVFAWAPPCQGGEYQPVSRLFGVRLSQKEYLTASKAAGMDTCPTEIGHAACKVRMRHPATKVRLLKQDAFPAMTRGGAAALEE